MYRIDGESAVPVGSITDVFEEADRKLMQGVRGALRDLDEAIALNNHSERLIEMHSVVLFAGAAYDLRSLRTGQPGHNEYGWVEVAREVCAEPEYKTRGARLLKQPFMSESQSTALITKSTYGVSKYNTKKAKSAVVPEPFLVASGLLVIDPDLAKHGLA